MGADVLTEFLCNRSFNVAGILFHMQIAPPPLPLKNDINSITCF